MKQWKTAAGCILAAIGLALSGCEKKEPNDTVWQENDTEVTVNTESESDKDLPVIDENQNLYGFSSILDPGSVVAAGWYGQELLFIEDESQADFVTMRIRTFSMETGELTERCVFTLPKADGDAGYYWYDILSYDPLVLYDYGSWTYYVFSEDLTEYRTVVFPEGYDHSAVYSVNDGSLYYMLWNEQVLRRVSLEKIFTDGTKVDAVADASVVWKPETNLGCCYLCGINDDGTQVVFSAYEMVDQVYLDLYYDLETLSYTEIYEQDETLYADWSSFDRRQNVFITYTDEWNTRITYTDADAAASYSCVFCAETYVADAQEEDVGTQDGPAVWLSLDSGCNERDGFLIFAAMDNATSKVCELVVWNYAASDKTPFTEDPLSDLTRAAVTEETDYGELTQEAEAVETEYGIKIVFGDNCKNQFINYTADSVTDPDLISAALDAIANSFKVFPDGFLEELRLNFTTGIIIYLTGTLTPENPDEYIDAIAVTSRCYGYEMITLDITQGGLEETLIHEMIHVIDNWFQNNGYEEDLNQAWEQYNPAGFTYYYSYFGYAGDWDNTASCDEYRLGNNLDAVYFYDDYAKTYPTEDRARTFEHFYDPEQILPYFYNDHFKGKIAVYLQFLEEHFASFYPGCDSLWEQMYRQICETET